MTINDNEPVKPTPEELTVIDSVPSYESGKGIPAEDAKETRRARDTARQNRLSALANTPPERAIAVFGAFADVPGLQESIDEVIARRNHRYGFTE